MRTLIAALAHSRRSQSRLRRLRYRSRRLRRQRHRPRRRKPKPAAGEPRDPEPHIYKLGEHLSEAYGTYEIVDNWQREKLMMPPKGIIGFATARTTFSSPRPTA